MNIKSEIHLNIAPYWLVKTPLTKILCLRKIIVRLLFMVTIVDIAKKVGVSTNTVSRILLGKKGRPKHHFKVLEAAKQMGYQKNLYASSLRTGRSDLVGLMVPDIVNPAYSMLYQNLKESLHERKLHILLTSTQTEEDLFYSLDLFMKYRVAGAIFNLSEGQFSKNIFKKIKILVSQDIPIVISGTQVGLENVGTICLNNIDSSYRATRYLYEKNKKTFLFIGGNVESMATEEREKGFLKALKEFQVPKSQYDSIYGEFTIESGGREFESYVTQVRIPEAVFCANDLIAIGVIKKAQELNISIPKQVSVIGFDDIPLASLVMPRLTTLRQPQKQIAMDIADYIQRWPKISGKKTALLKYTPELVLRDSA